MFPFLSCVIPKEIIMRLLLIWFWSRLMFGLWDVRNSIAKMWIPVALLQFLAFFFKIGASCTYLFFYAFSSSSFDNFFYAFSVFSFWIKSLQFKKKKVSHAISSQLSWVLFSGAKSREKVKWTQWTPCNHFNIKMVTDWSHMRIKGRNELW